MTPRIPKRSSPDAASATGRKSGDGSLFPLNIEFIREHKEHVAMMFDITGVIVSGGKSPRKWSQIIVLFLATVLATLAIFRLLESFGPQHISIPAVAFGFAAGGLFVGVVGTIFQGGYKKLFRERLRDGVISHVTFDEEGVRSVTDQIDLHSPWHLINDIIVKDDLLILVDEVWAHYVPARALSSGITMQALETECKRRCEAAMGIRS